MEDAELDSSLRDVENCALHISAKLPKAGSEGDIELGAPAAEVKLFPAFPVGMLEVTVTDDSA